MVSYRIISSSHSYSHSESHSCFLYYVECSCLITRSVELHTYNTTRVIECEGTIEGNLPLLESEYSLCVTENELIVSSL